MTVEQIRKILHEDAPFVIHVVSGRQFRVAHTDYAALSMSEKMLLFTDEKENLELIRLSSIESITIEQKKPAA
jgi:hypothetical protein